MEIDTFDAQFGLPAANLTMVPTDDSVPIPYSDTAQECELDVEWAHAVAPNTPIVLYVITNPSQGAFDALSLAVAQNACGTISSSVHACANEAELKAYFTIEAQAVVQGQTLFHASGDFGSFFACGQPAKYQRTTNVQPSIDETASSPDVTVVGGTQFSPVWGPDGANTSRLAPNIEHVWNELTLSAGISGASQAAGGPGRPGSKISGGGRDAGQLAAVLGLLGLGLILMPGSNRRRMRLFSAMFLLIAATQLGCGGDNNNNGVAVLGTSEQSVPACGVGVSSANGAVGVTGLPAALSQIRLVN